MIEILALVVLTVFTVYYFYFITRVRMGLLLLQAAPTVQIQQNVTVVVAARNEEKSIGQCLQSLVQQTYPPNKYEILIVDDGSTDMTASIVNEFSQRYARIRLLSLSTGDGRETGRNKPLAITKGINHAEGEIILTTDADCTAPPKWIECMIHHFQDDVVFVAGPVAVQDSPHFFNKLEQLEFLGLITTAAGLIGSGKPIICNGANLAYRKNAFNAVNGFGKLGSFNDDESLMNRMIYRKTGRIVFAPESDAVIVTRSAETMASFIKQRIRWANKRRRYEDKSILVMLVSLYLFFVSVVFIALLIPFERQLLVPVIIVLIGKGIIDYFALHSGAKLFLQRVKVFQFIIAELLHVPYIVLTAAIGQFSSIRWKGRTVR
jgi:cellulose synthase/poly-beta-1,6-N-acetylglucosamine synthase-like glycosyltransferase